MRKERAVGTLRRKVRLVNSFAVWFGAGKEGRKAHNAYLMRRVMQFTALPPTLCWLSKMGPEPPLNHTKKSPIVRTSGRIVAVGSERKLVFVS